MAVAAVSSTLCESWRWLLAAQTLLWRHAARLLSFPLDGSWGQWQAANLQRQPDQGGGGAIVPAPQQPAQKVLLQCSRRMKVGRRTANIIVLTFS